jgi:probable phosphomutase (TIGR03848 family)
VRRWPASKPEEPTASLADRPTMGVHVATLLLVRHGTTAVTGKRLGGWTDASLDDRGREQVAATAERLRDVPVAAVYSSPIVRTRETARIIADVLGQKVRTRKGLGEVEYGDWTDQPLGQLRRRKLWKVIQSTPSRVTFPNGGSIRGAQSTAVETLEDLAGEHAEDTIVAVSHADVIKAVVAHFLGMPLDTFQRLVVSPASVTALHLAEGEAPMLLRFNDTGPLELPRSR